MLTASAGNTPEFRRTIYNIGVSRNYYTCCSALSVYEYSNSKTSKTKFTYTPCLLSSCKNVADAAPAPATLGNKSDFQRGSYSTEEEADNVVDAAFLSRLSSASRARANVFELAYCNDWDYFFTGTIDPNKYDRTDLKKFRKDLAQFIRDYRKKTGYATKYVIVPELHSDKKCWHVHGFLSNIPDCDVPEFHLGDRMGFYIAKKVKEGMSVRNWIPYANKFGFCDLEPVGNQEAACNYVTKYISKSLLDDEQSELYNHRYFASQGLNRRKLLLKVYGEEADEMFNDIFSPEEMAVCEQGNKDRFEKYGINSKIYVKWES